MPLLDSNHVAIADGFTSYPTLPPYSPEQAGPEYPFSAATLARSPNSAYAGVREALSLLGLDREHAGTRGWNPLRDIVRPGDMVVLKPNFVREFRETQPGHADCVTTHGSVIRAVLDYVFIALGGTGRITHARPPGRCR